MTRRARVSRAPIALLKSVLPAESFLDLDSLSSDSSLQRGMKENAS